MLVQEGLAINKSGLIIGLAIVAISFSPVTASSAVPAKKYESCQELRLDYPGGVAKSKNWKNKGGALKNTPVVNAKVYNLNAARDRDKDGLACES